MCKIINLVVFLDGTWNTIESETNVFKMKQKIHDGSYSFENDNIIFKTLSHYEEGPGTTSNNNIIGGAFATDLPIQIANTYNWLTRVFSSCAVSSDVHVQIFLFGFSRGAYAAHILSWILSECGIPKNYSKSSEYVCSYLKYKENQF